MAVYTHLSFEEIRQLLTHYSLGNLHDAKGIAEGVENTNYRIETREGEETQRYILTLFEKRVRGEELPFFMGVMGHLAEHHFPAPRPIPLRTGEYTFCYQGKPVCLVSFLTGRPVEKIGSAHLSALGQIISAMHEALADCKEERPNDLGPDGWQQLYVKVKAGLNSIDGRLEKEIGQILEHTCSDWPQDLPMGIIHADLFPDNVFFDGDAVSGVIDFYFACRDFLAYELAICINAWCFDGEKSWNPGKAKALIAGYEQIRPLSHEEKAALPILMRGAALRFFLTRAHDWLFHDDNALVTPKDPMEYAAKLRHHMEGVTRIFEDVI